MKHPLLLGHFDRHDPTGGPRVFKPLDLDVVRRILSETCDRDSDGAPILGTDGVTSAASGRQWLGQLGKEDVYFESGRLVCPWLGIGFNKPSLAFISRLYTELNCQIFEPGDGVFYTPEQLRLIAEDYYRA
jgi:hypothetical protein